MIFLLGFLEGLSHAFNDAFMFVPHDLGIDRRVTDSGGN